MTMSINNSKGVKNFENYIFTRVWVKFIFIMITQFCQNLKKLINKIYGNICSTFFISVLLLYKLSGTNNNFPIQSMRLELPKK